MSCAAKDDDCCKRYYNDNAPANLELRVLALLFAFVIYKHHRFLCPGHRLITAPSNIAGLNVQFLHFNAQGFHCRCNQAIRELC